MAVKNIPIGHKIYKHLPSKDPIKFAPKFGFLV
jgi:hypothetical protein